MPLQNPLLLFVKYSRELCGRGGKLNGHGLQILCTKNKEHRKFSVTPGANIIFQRYCLQTNVVMFEKLPVLTTPFVFFTMRNRQSLKYK